MVDKVIEFIDLVDMVAPSGVAFQSIAAGTAGAGIQQIIQNMQIVLTTEAATVHQLHVELWYDGTPIEEWNAGAGFGLNIDLNGNMLLAYTKSSGVAVEALDSTGAPVNAPITYSIYAAGVITD